MGSTKTILKRATAYALAFVMAFSMLFTGNNVLTTNAAATVSKLTVKKSKVTIDLSKSSTKTVKVTVKGSNQKFTAKSSKKSVATVKVVKKTVVITGKKKGTAKITVTTKGKNSKNKKLKKTIKVTVKGTAPATTAEPTTQAPTTEAPKPEDKYNSVKITTPTTADGSTPSVNVGTSTKLTAAVDATDADKVVWTSSNPSVAVVSKDGTVTGVTAGTTEAIATMNGKEIGRISITISSVAVTGVTLDHTTLDLTVGKSSTLAATVLPANATVRTVSWSSSDLNVAKVTDGVVEALGKGEATITVTTTDKAFTATCVVTVKEDTSADVNGVVATVSNSIEGFPNTVLVGDRAKIDIKVTKDGAPFGDDSVGVVLKPVSGYSDYYELDKTSVDTKSNGTATVYLQLKNGHSESAIVWDVDDSENSGFAYASFNVELTSGGSNKKTTIPVSFAQVIPETASTYSAIDVENINDLEKTDAKDAVQVTTNTQGYNEEYIVDQQVSTSYKDHSVVFDAAPTLRRSPTLDEKASDVYNVDLDYQKFDYSVYSNEDDACVIENVPGGLKYITLTFGKLKLSKYSRVIVRAYHAQTNRPYTYDDHSLVQDIITSDRVIKSASNNTISIDKKVFNDITKDQKYIDIKVFVESAGQINDDDNEGFSLTNASGEYANENMKDFADERLSGAVSWVLGHQKNYNAQDTLENARDYIGAARYVSTNKYMYSVPAFPETGNAIIEELDANDQHIKYYLYPTRAQSNKNVLVTANPSYCFDATTKQVTELTTYTKNISEDNYLTLDSTVAGYIPIKASITFGVDADGEPKVSYDVYSFVQWSPTPTSVTVQPIDYYALAGQTVTLTAIVKDENGNEKGGISVDWKKAVEDRYETLSKDNLSGVTITNKGKTNDDGITTIELQAANNADALDIIAEASGFNVTLKVADEVVRTSHASIHWVKPGVYYKDDVDGTEYNTSDKTADEKAAASIYKTSTNWIIGTKVVGKISDDTKEVDSISNIEINMVGGSEVDGLNSAVQEKSNGVGTVTNTKTGEAKVTVSLGGIISETAPTVISIRDLATNTITEYNSVGKGSFTKGSNLEIPVIWTVNGAKLNLVNDYTKYDINNGRPVIVYAQVIDNTDNPVEGAKVTYHVTNANGDDVIAEREGTTNEDGLIPIELTAPVEVNDNTSVYTLTAYITDNGIASSTSTTVTFVNDSQGSFKLVNTAISNESKTVTLTFDSNVDAKLIDKGFIKIKNAAGDSVDIKNIAVRVGNNQVIDITTDDVDLTGATVEIISSTENAPIYYFLNANGVLYTEEH